ncbi:MAG TPA: helix-turn-helix domain-containing protein [Bacilli bacterium]|nr:helix-turn-helix domain-containing protein [Bacilli bacterium]
MRFKVDFILKNNQSRFRKYLTYYSKLVYDYINREEKRIYSIDTYISYLKIAKLDGFFNDLLTIDELYALHDWTHEKQESYELPLLVERAYQKWQEVFFNKEFDYLFKELNPVGLGIVLRAIRECNNINKADLAKMIGVNRKTVFLIENGERLPSLEYVYKFSRIFEMKIDEIITYSV